MKYSPSGLTAKIAKWTAETGIIVAFMLAGVVSGIAPYTAVVGPITLLLLIGGYLYILPAGQIDEYPKHTAGTVLMLSASQIFFVAMVEAPESLVSPEGAVAGIALAVIFAVGVWKDFVLEPMDLGGFEVEIGKSDR